MSGIVIARLAQITASVFFLLLAITVANSVLSMAAGPQSALSVAALFSKLCVIVFYTLIVWFTLTRAQPRAQATGWRPRVTALLGTFLFMASLVWLKRQEDFGIASHLISAWLVATGSALMLAILLHLGKSFSIMAEARTLVTGGPYAIVRHPLYVAETIATVGVLIGFFRGLPSRSSSCNSPVKSSACGTRRPCCSARFRSTMPGTWRERNV
jgi:hypothetical protein